MPISVISSLSFWARNAAIEQFLSARSEVGEQPLLLTIDLLDSQEDGELSLRITRQAPASTASSTISWEGNCASCATLALLSDYFDHSLEEREIIVVLPVGVSLKTCISAAEQAQVPVKNALLALDPSTLEDDLWDSGMMSSRVSSGGCDDERTPGEFLVGEVGWADTAVLAEIPLTHSTAAERERAEELLEHIGPHLALLRGEATSCGCFERQLAFQRSQAGYLPTEPLADGKNFRTVVLTSQKPISQEKLAEALPRMVEGACRVRGTVQLEEFPGEEIAVEGIGPAVWLASQGETKRPLTTTIAITGDDLDPQELQELFDSCQTTDQPA